MTHVGFPNPSHTTLDNLSANYCWDNEIRDGNCTAAALIESLQKLRADYVAQFGEEDEEPDWDKLERYARLYEPTAENLCYRAHHGLLDSEKLRPQERDALQAHWASLTTPVCEVWCDYPRPEEENPENWEQEPSGVSARRSHLCGGTWILVDEDYGYYVIEDERSLDIRIQDESVAA